ncbi:DUF2497 domain-containing protein [Polymorphobacter megasporae]|uniref:DUF2497 domain-containing protein n=1 Tax=Glacieibacterium megasporae TaxID=2835787 RepID=UPI001C1E3893|nr:DUF2497 domain-containing protein [Polymorphobacter megasporae]UAJ10820.1 DUF2497 domain-containing protein [Polymorphobacter megasporae]
MSPEAELPQSIDDIMASIRASLADDGPPVVPAQSAAARPPALPPVPSVADISASLDDVVRSMVGPMLQTWLDTHLPEIVERVTHEEIRRLTGRTD